MRRAAAQRTWVAYQAVQAFAFSLGWTVAPVFFVRELDFSPLELVLAGTALELAYFAFEIPTGIVADTYGRRLSILAGVTGLGLGFVATGLANGVWLVLAAAAFMGFTWTFKSGADEAWITDEVGAGGAARSFHAGAQAGRIGALTGIAAAVGLALLDLRLPIVAGGVVMLALACTLAAVMPETGFVSARGESISALTSMRQTARQGGGLIRRNPLLLLIVGIAFLHGASDEGFDRLWEAHFLVDVGVPGFGGLDQVVWFGVLGAGALLLAILVAQPLSRRLSGLGLATMAKALLVADGLRIVALLAFAFAGSFAVAVVARCARALHLAERQRRGLARAGHRALDDERLRLGGGMGRRSRSRPRGQRVRHPCRPRLECCSAHARARALRASGEPSRPRAGARIGFRDGFDLGHRDGTTYRRDLAGASRHHDADDGDTELGLERQGASGAPRARSVRLAPSALRL